MKYFWLAVALVLTAGAGIAAAQTDAGVADTRVAAAGLYSLIPSSSILPPSPGTTKVAACSGRMVNSCSSQTSQSACTGAYEASSSSASGTLCVWSGGHCMNGSPC